MIVDSHHHFWRYSQEEYGRIPDSMAQLRRDFLPADLRQAIAGTGVEGVVTVQVRRTIEETEWMLAIARDEPLIRGVVGWAPLADRNAEREVERMAADAKLKGLREILQDEPLNDLMDDAAFREGVAMLGRHDLVYDILIYERHLVQALRFLGHFPESQVFVLDHIAKPRIRECVMEPWRTQIRELARRPNVYCKVSGMVTEADWTGWRPSDLDPYFDTVLEAFGPRRLMYGSDWPVVLPASSYARWFGTLQALVSKLSRKEQERFWSGTAVEAYGLR